MSMDDEANQLLQELSDAKTLAMRLKGRMDNNEDVRAQIKEGDEKIDLLEKRAKEAMKRLGCVSPETRTVYHHMADMLINWQTFKDSLE
ncbi:MAG: hypothetical protein SWE60_14325 [Thermodesulfobacteriota bacterium]|nr:hypothetical protein [Thermodesulfobacteriota bacterium]